MLLFALFQYVQLVVMESRAKENVIVSKARHVIWSMDRVQRVVHRDGVELCAMERMVIYIHFYINLVTGCMPIGSCSDRMLIAYENCFIIFINQ